MCTSIFEFIIWEITQNQTNFFHFHKKAKTGQARIYDVTYCIVWKVIPHPTESQPPGYNVFLMVESSGRNPFLKVNPWGFGVL